MYAGVCCMSACVCVSMRVRGCMGASVFVGMCMRVRVQACCFSYYTSLPPPQPPPPPPRHARRPPPYPSHPRRPYPTPGPHPGRGQLAPAVLYKSNPNSAELISPKLTRPRATTWTKPPTPSRQYAHVGGVFDAAGHICRIP